jgi:hypothetical protein
MFKRAKLDYLYINLTTDDNGNPVELYPTQEEMFKKINEIINYVNRLDDKVFMGF